MNMATYAAMGLTST